MCPGIPDLAERERQDAMPAGLYRQLAADGVLVVNDGRRVSKPTTLLAVLEANGIRPAVGYHDRFLRGELRDGSSRKFVYRAWSDGPRLGAVGWGGSCLRLFLACRLCRRAMLLVRRRWPSGLSCWWLRPVLRAWGLTGDDGLLTGLVRRVHPDRPGGRDD